VQPVVGAAHQGLRGPDGQVEVRRAGDLSIRFEPAGSVSTARRLLTQLGWQLQPYDGEPYGFKEEHARRIAHALRMLCGIAREADELEEIGGVVATFLSSAVPVEGCTTYGGTENRFAAVEALRPEVSRHYLVDKNTGEFVIRVGDLQAAAREFVGSSLPRGWLDGRMQLLDWTRLQLQGHREAGRGGRRAGHARCDVYRGLLPVDE
jgi:hypothetical protein